MIEYLKDWYQRNLSNPQAVILVLMIVFGTFIVLYWGDILAPVLAPLTVQIGMEPVHAGIMIILALNISLIVAYIYYYEDTKMMRWLALVLVAGFASFALC